MLTVNAKGVFTISVTPFLPDGQIDIKSLERVCNFYVEKGANGLTVLGMMGEAGKLSATEAQTVVKCAVRTVDVPVIVGVSASGFASMKALAEEAMALGAAGVMVAPPHTLQTDAQILNYYRETAVTLGDIPFVLQDFPLATGVVVPTTVILQIIEDCPTCVMLKHEDWPGLDKISALRAASDAGARRISILCGNGGLYLNEEMGRGADGAMTGFAYPEMMAQVIAAREAGDTKRASDLFDAYLPLIRYEAQPGLGLALRKYTLARRGAIAHDTVRRPGGTLNAQTITEVDALILRQERRLAELS